MTAARLAEEFGFELVLHHGTEAYRVADELARRKIPVSLTLVDSPGGKLEVAAFLEENAAVLAKAGVLIAINTDDYITESRFMLRTGAIAVRGPDRRPHRGRQRAGDCPPHDAAAGRDGDVQHPRWQRRGPCRP
jgi:hypothetical protein